MIMRFLQLGLLFCIAWKLSAEENPDPSRRPMVARLHLESPFGRSTQVLRRLHGAVSGLGFGPCPRRSSAMEEELVVFQADAACESTDFLPPHPIITPRSSSSPLTSSNIHRRNSSKSMRARQTGRMSRHLHGRPYKDHLKGATARAARSGRTLLALVVRRSTGIKCGITGSTSRGFLRGRAQVESFRKAFLILRWPGSWRGITEGGVRSCDFLGYLMGRKWAFLDDNLVLAPELAADTDTKGNPESGFGK
ncbi:MAG: hypothetical protein M1816_004603 [Peltula sp. TS41687]|nr:MAG: hypothetical protein M1816_004603 [Peltula sp. TS41687]